VLGAAAFGGAVAWSSGQGVKAAGQWAFAAGRTAISKGGGAAGGANPGPKTLWRGDKRAPSAIEDAGGFQPKGTNTDVADYVKNETPSAFVGTSSRRHIAESFAMRRNAQGWVYEMSNPGGGRNATKAMGGWWKNPFATESEWLFDSIPMSNIKGAQLIRWGKVMDTWVNPGFKG
jgi:hypothetical protein